MKIVDAFWEERNLGVTCHEVAIDREDSLAEILARLPEIEQKQYVVFKVNTLRSDVMRALEDRGYRYIETLLTLNLNRNDFVIPQKLQPIIDRCTWAEMNESEIERLCREVENGLFHTDRVYNDPAFTHAQAAHRYSCWIKDLARQGVPVHKVMYGDDEVGFFISKEVKPGVHDGILIGAYAKYQHSGLGYCVLCCQSKYVYDLGVKNMLGRVSTNNPDVIKVATDFGNKIRQVDSVFVKHIAS